MDYRIEEKRRLALELSQKRTVSAEELKPYRRKIKSTTVVFTEINGRPVQLYSAALMAERCGMTSTSIQKQLYLGRFPIPISLYYFKKQNNSYVYFTEEEAREYSACLILHRRRAGRFVSAPTVRWQTAAIDLWERHEYLRERFFSGEFPLIPDAEAKEAIDDFFQEIANKREKRGRPPKSEAKVDNWATVAGWGSHVQNKRRPECKDVVWRRAIRHVGGD